MQDAQLAGGPIVVVVVVVEEARSTDVPSHQLKIQRDKNGPSDKERRAGVGGGRKRTKAMGKKRSHSRGRRAGKEGGGSRKARTGKATSMTERRGVKWDRDDGNASDDVSGGLLTMLRC